MDQGIPVYLNEGFELYQGNSCRPGLQFQEIEITEAILRKEKEPFRDRVAGPQ